MNKQYSQNDLAPEWLLLVIILEVFFWLIQLIKTNNKLLNLLVTWHVSPLHKRHHHKWSDDSSDLQMTVRFKVKSLVSLTITYYLFWLTGLTKRRLPKLLRESRMNLFPHTCDKLRDCMSNSIEYQIKSSISEMRFFGAQIT